MNPFSLGLLFTVVTTFGLALWVLYLQRHSTMHRIFALYLFSIGFWASFSAVQTLSSDPALVSLAVRVMHWGAIFISVFYLHFIYHLTGKIPRWFLRLCYGIAFVFLILNHTPLFVLGIQPKRPFHYFMTAGPVYPLYILFFLLTWSYAVVHLALEARKSEGRKKTQLKLLFIGSLIGYVGGSGAFLPVYDLKFPLLYPYGNFAIAIYVSIMTYAIIRHHFLDIEVIIKRTLVFAGLLAFVFGVYSLGLFFTKEVLAHYFRFNEGLAMSVSIFLVVLGYEPMRTFLINATDRFLSQKKIDYEKIEEEVSNSIKITDLDKLCETLVNIFHKEMNLENALLFLFEEDRRIFRSSARKGMETHAEVTFEEDDPFLQTLGKDNRRTVFVKADLQPNEEDLRQGFARLKSEAIAKVIFEDRLIAFLSLGRKKSDEDYNIRDRQLLLKSANQMAVSISHATIFRLQRDYYVLQAQRNKSDALSRLSEGLDHEIKNPLNQIRPRLENVLDFYESKDISPECTYLVESLQTSMKHVDRISKIMERLRRFARPVEGESVKLAPLNLKSFIEEAVGLISEKQLEIDGIKIASDIPENLSRIFAEETSLVQVFYNLIVNAYHAIDRNGTIQITARDNVSDGRVVVEISDTGKGIAPENMSKIFEPFFTTKPTNITAGSAERFTGTGLGLAFVQKYMEDLGGTVTVSSQIGKGTTFFLKFLKAGGEGVGEGEKDSFN